MWLSTRTTNWVRSVYYIKWNVKEWYPFHGIVFLTVIQIYNAHSKCECINNIKFENFLATMFLALGGIDSPDFQSRRPTNERRRKPKKKKKFGAIPITIESMHRKPNRTRGQEVYKEQKRNDIVLVTFCYNIHRLDWLSGRI